MKNGWWWIRAYQGGFNIFLIFACICSLKRLDYAGKMKQKEKDLKVNGSGSLAFSMMLY